MTIRALHRQLMLPAGGPFATESFTVADSSNWPSQWTKLRNDGYGTGAGGATVVSNQGKLGAQSVNYQVIRRGMSTVNAKNVRFKGTIIPNEVRSGSECYAEIVLRQDASSTAYLPDGLTLTFIFQSNVQWYLAVSSQEEGELLSGDPTTFAAVSGEPINVDFSAVDGVMTGKVWKVSAGEASAVTKTLAADTFTRLGTVALGYTSGSISNPGVIWDNIEIYNLG